MCGKAAWCISFRYITDLAWIFFFAKYSKVCESKQKYAKVNKTKQITQQKITLKVVNSNMYLKEYVKSFLKRFDEFKIWIFILKITYFYLRSAQSWT